MKKLLFFSLIASFAFLTSCNKDDDSDHNDDALDYSISINSPTTEDKKVNDTVPIEVVFKSGTGGTIHHINVRVYNVADNSIEAYNGPAEAHVMEASGTYTFTYDLVLNSDNNVTAHSDWIVEAKVWGHEAGSEEKIETLQFHVHPQFAYSIAINNPNTDDKHVNDVLPIEVVFNSGNGSTVHHVKVRIYNAADNTIEAYNGPDDAHVMETSGTYTLSQDLLLNSEPTGFWKQRFGATKWVLRRK